MPRLYTPKGAENIKKGMLLAPYMGTNESAIRLLWNALYENCSYQGELLLKSAHIQMKFYRGLKLLSDNKNDFLFFFKKIISNYQ